MDKKRIAIRCAIALGVLAALALNPIGCFFIGVVLSVGQIRKAESAMRDPKVFEQVAERLALYCQSDQSLFPQYLNYAWLPEDLNAVRHGWASVSTNYAHVEMGGGFHHFGYRLKLDIDASSPKTNVWQLHMYSEGSSDRHLKTLHVGAERHFLPDEMLTMVIDGFDAQILRKPHDERAHQGKIQTYLRFDQVDQARDACRSMLKAMPDNWWPVLVNALILAEENSFNQAEEFMLQWVGNRKNFFRYMDLAYFYQLLGNAGKAAEAMRQSTQYTGNVPWGHGGNAEHRGWTAAMFAYEAGEYATVVQLCDHLLKVKINGDYAKPRLREMRMAAIKAEQAPGEAPPLKWADGLRPFDPFEDIDIEKLLQRSVPRMTREQYWQQRQ